MIGGERAGHADADDVLAAHGFDGDGGGERGIDAAAEPDEHAREAALADVVARAEDQGFVDGFAFVGEVGVEVALAGDGVDEDQVFGERRGGGDDFAVGIHGEAAAVEDQRVVAADLVDGDDAARRGGARRRPTCRGAARACPC